MKPHRGLRLPARLLLSYAVVIAVGAATAYVTIRLLLPPLFDHQMQMGIGSHGTMRSAGTHDALVSALNTALLVAVLASAAASGAVAAFVTHRLLRPLSAVRDATRRIAAGDYHAKVGLPREPELAALASDVNTLAATLGQTEMRRTRLLGDVAHEMRTPLTALDGYVEGLIDGVIAPRPENLQAMAQELHRLHRLADDLASLSRAEERRVDLHLAAVELTGLVRSTVARLRPQFDDVGVAVDVNTPASLPVTGDPDRLSQILTNLLGNALIASSRGGRVTVQAGALGGLAVLTVTDTGVGLPVADLERIFERFYRAPTALRRSSGSGVGLTIARGLVRAHGGDLRAASPGPGRGATFTLTLPLRAPAAAEPPALPAGTLAPAREISTGASSEVAATVDPRSSP